MQAAKVHCSTNGPYTTRCLGRVHRSETLGYVLSLPLALCPKPRSVRLLKRGLSLEDRLNASVSCCQRRIQVWRQRARGSRLKRQLKPMITKLHFKSMMNEFTKVLKSATSIPKKEIDCRRSLKLVRS